MGSEFYSIEQAMRRLGKSRRSIYNYIDKGFLTKNEKGVPKTDVEQLAVELGTDAPALTRASWFQMNARLKRLENEMMAVKHILEIRDQPLRPNSDEAKGLYSAATESLARGGWGVEEMTLWAKQFEAFDEVTLKSIATTLQNTLAWQPFFSLCLGMMQQAWDMRTKKPTLESQALHQKLDEGRKRMRSVILMWISSGQGLLPEAFLATLENPKETVSRRLGAG